MRTVERSHLMLWLEGYLLKFENGQGDCVNEIACEAAQNALSNGETIALTENNKIISYVVPETDGYYERETPD